MSTACWARSRRSGKMQFLGIDASNYTTSAALYDTASGEIRMEKQPLPVREGALGLRQCNAVFAHTKQIAALLRRLTADGVVSALSGIGVSAFPRRENGSYMPCFLVGRAVAESVGALYGLPVHLLSHQEGHILSALYSAGLSCLPENGLYAVHLSGGTTDCLLVTADEEHLISVKLLASSLDLKAGQAVDRVGKMLGLPFPAGPELERLAMECKEPVRAPKPTLRGVHCSLSGVENRSARLYREGKPPEYIAKFCLMSIGEAVAAMLRAVIQEYGSRPVLFAGGVMSNRLLQAELLDKFEGYVAEPAFSADNAAGCALYAAGMEWQKWKDA